MRRFVVAGLAPGPVRLSAEESHHLLHVLRARRGAIVGLTDGAGALAEGTLVDVRDAIALIDVGPLHREAPRPARTLLMGWPKAALAEEAVQLGTEAGATRFLGVPAARSPLPAPRAERLDRIIEAAVVQCGRAVRPELLLRPSLAAALLEVGPGARFIGAPGAAPLGRVDGPAVVAIGPEGGWTDAEVQTLQHAGFAPVSFGAHILRAPTAVAVALGALGPG